MNRLLFTLTLMVLFHNCIFSQVEEDFLKRQHRSAGFDYAKFTIGASIGANLFNNIKAVPGSVDIYNHAKAGMYLSLDLACNLSKRFALEASFDYFKLKYTIDHNYIYNQPNDPSIPIHSDLDNFYMRVPVSVCYAFIAGEKISVFAKAGFMSSFLLTSNSSTVYADNSTRQFEYSANSLSGINYGLGIQYRLSAFTVLKFESSFERYSKGFDDGMYQNPSIITVKSGIATRIDWNCFFTKGAWRPLPRCN
jgi:hypothetical protein